MNLLQSPKRELLPSAAVIQSGSGGGQTLGVFFSVTRRKVARNAEDIEDTRRKRERERKGREYF